MVIRHDVAIFLMSQISFFRNICTVKLVYNDHPWDLEKVVVVQRWSIFRGSCIIRIITYFSFVLRSCDFKDFVDDSSETNEVRNDELMSQGSSNQNNIFIDKPEKI